MSKAGWGVINTERVRCGICGKLESFVPSHRTIHRARVHARVLGWSYRPDLGWVCPLTHRDGRSSTPASRVQATLPGFAHASRNAGAHKA